MEYSDQVDAYVRKNAPWAKSLKLLRAIVKTTELEEAVKWGGPVYTLSGKNVLGLGAFKNYVCIWFFQGALLKDSRQVLVNAQEGKTKALRQWRFKSYEDINDDEVKNYVTEAIRNQQAGKVIKASKPAKKPLIIPKQMQDHFEQHQSDQLAFNKFSLTRKREFTDYIVEAKRLQTKSKRLQKVIKLIKEGRGLYDQYK